MCRESCGHTKDRTTPKHPFVSAITGRSRGRATRCQNPSGEALMGKRMRGPERLPHSPVHHQCRQGRQRSQRSACPALSPKERRTSFADADEGENEKALRSTPFASTSSGDDGSLLLGRDTVALEDPCPPSPANPTRPVPRPVDPTCPAMHGGYRHAAPIPTVETRW